MTVRPTFIYAEPTVETLWRVLYIVIREETDVLHQMTLPTMVPTGHYLYVRWGKDSRLFYGFIPHRNLKLLTKGQTERAKRSLIEHREWYFDWHGDAFGPFPLPECQVLSMAHLRLGRELALTNKLLEGDPTVGLLSFANKHLYSFA